MGVSLCSYPPFCPPQNLSITKYNFVTKYFKKVCSYDHLSCVGWKEQHGQRHFKWQLIIPPTWGQVGDFINKHLSPFKYNTPGQKSLAWKTHTHTHTLRLTLTLTHSHILGSWLHGFVSSGQLFESTGHFIFSFFQTLPQSTSLHCLSQTLLCFSKRETLNLLSSALKGLCLKPHMSILNRK